MNPKRETMPRERPRRNRKCISRVADANELSWANGYAKGYGLNSRLCLEAL